jgi:hypothetical protein
MWAIRLILISKSRPGTGWLSPPARNLRKFLTRRLMKAYRIGAADSRPYDVLLARAHEEIRQ